MASSLIESILGMLRPEISQAIASRLGEPSQNVQNGLSGATAAILSALEKRSGDTDFLSQVLILVGGASGQNILGNLHELAVNGPTGSTAELVNRFLKLVLGSQQDQLAGLVAQKSGLRVASGKGVLSTVAPLILGFFAKMASSGDLNLSSLGEILHAEWPVLERYSPAEILHNVVENDEEGESARMGDTGKWLMLLGALGAGLVGWLVYSAWNMPK